MEEQIFNKTMPEWFESRMGDCLITRFTEARNIGPRMSVRPLSLLRGNERIPNYEAEQWCWDITAFKVCDGFLWDTFMVELGYYFSVAEYEVDHEISIGPEEYVFRVLVDEISHLMHVRLEYGIVTISDVVLQQG